MSVCGSELSIEGLDENILIEPLQGQLRHVVPVHVVCILAVWADRVNNAIRYLHVAGPYWLYGSCSLLVRARFSMSIGLAGAATGEAREGCILLRVGWPHSLGALYTKAPEILLLLLDEAIVDDDKLLVGLQLVEWVLAVV